MTDRMPVKDNSVDKWALGGPQLSIAETLSKLGHALRGEGLRGASTHFLQSFRNVF